MKFKRPKILKNFQECFHDKRGFLNPISFKDLFDDKNFNPLYQLMSYTKSKNTFRGFHFQKPPSQQRKMLLVHSGEILDIVFPYDDPKKNSVEIFDLQAGDMLMIPNNFAHGFFTKSSGVLLQYFLDQEFSPKDYTGLNGENYISELVSRDDIIISENDKNLPEINFD